MCGGWQSRGRSIAGAGSVADKWRWATEGEASGKAEGDVPGGGREVRQVVVGKVHGGQWQRGRPGEDRVEGGQLQAKSGGRRWEKRRLLDCHIEWNKS